MRDVTMRSLRRQCGIVLQEPVLFAGSIAHNIRYARPDATDAEVEAAARAVGLFDTIEKLPQQFETLVNERGVGMSIGQRQLISFARVLIADPRILVLDEATASLDTGTELVVQKAIREVTRGRTAIMIAHRLSTIRDADRIIVMEQGRIVEEGPHDELIAKRGAYYRYYSLGFQQAVAGPATAQRRQTRRSHLTLRFGRLSAICNTVFRHLQFPREAFCDAAPTEFLPLTPAASSARQCLRRCCGQKIVAKRR